jgi:hypothetical protein
MTDDIIQGDYLFKVQARNWVGDGAESDVLTVSVPWRISQVNSVLFDADETALSVD